MLYRYTYCLNNPLIYTDPSGESFLAFAIGFGVMAYLSGVADNNGELNLFQWDPKQTDFVKMGFMGLLGGFGGCWVEGLELGTSAVTVGAQIGTGLGIPSTFIGINYSQNDNFSFKWTNNLGQEGLVPLNNLAEGNFSNVSVPSSSSVTASIHNSMNEWRNSKSNFQKFKDEYWAARTSFIVGPLTMIGWEYEFENDHVFTLNYFEIGGDLILGGSVGIGWVKDEYTGKRRFIYGKNKFLSTTPSVGVRYNRMNYYYSGSTDYSIRFLSENVAYETNIGGGPGVAGGGIVFHRYGSSSPFYGNGAYFDIGPTLFPAQVDFGFNYSYFRKRHR
jgi:hypothetical protein